MARATVNEEANTIQPARGVPNANAAALGLLCGLGVSIFSKPLALLIGLLVLGVQVGCQYCDLPDVLLSGVLYESITSCV